MPPCAELTRAVKELGFKGVMVNGFSQVGDADTIVYYDDPRYRPFWATVAELGVPFYLHPRDPLAEPRRRSTTATRGCEARRGRSASRRRRTRYA